MEINLNNMSHSKAKTLGETYDNVLELEKSILEFRATIRVPPKGTIRLPARMRWGFRN